MILMEAITIFISCKLCMGLLSSTILMTSNTVQPPETVSVTSSSVNFTAQVAKTVSEKGQPEVSEYEEDLYSESIVPDEEDYYEENNKSCFSEGFDSEFKAYMDYRCITDTSSVQYSLQEQAYTDDRGFRRIGDDYCVALGTGLTSGCGERFLITLDSGYSFTAIVSDIKADIHTDSTNCYAPRGENAGNIVEFIIDSDNADDYMLTCGTAGCFEDLSGNVTSVQPI